jgi:hypothetical protein
MMKSVPPRLRRPLLVLVIGVVALVVIGAIHGWAAVAYIAPIVVVLVIGYYVWGGRDSDLAAIIRLEPDERQADLLIRVEALVGRVLSLAVLVAYIVAISTHVRLWPFAVLLAVPVGAGAIGWAFYHERNNSNPPRAARD